MQEWKWKKELKWACEGGKKSSAIAINQALLGAIAVYVCNHNYLYMLIMHIRKYLD